MPTLLQKYEVTRVLPNIEHCFIVSHLTKQCSQCFFCLSISTNVWILGIDARQNCVFFEIYESYKQRVVHRKFR